MLHWFVIYFIGNFLYLFYIFIFNILRYTQLLQKMQALPTDLVAQRIYDVAKAKLGALLQERVDLEKISKVVKTVMEKVDEISQALDQKLSSERKQQLAIEIIKRI